MSLLSQKPLTYSFFTFLMYTFEGSNFPQSSIQGSMSIISGSILRDDLLELVVEKRMTKQKYNKDGLVIEDSIVEIQDVL